MNFFLQLFKYAGAFAAIVLCIGFVSKSDLSSLLSTQTSQAFSEDELAPTQEYATLGLGKAREDLRGESSSPRGGFSDRSELPTFRDAPRSSSNIRTVAHTDIAPVNNRNVVSSSDINSWIDMSVAQTFLEAEKETISPGVILATGIYFLQQGQGDLSMSAADVAAYLAEVRDNAGAAAKSHMKYIANSEEWFEGLSLAGFDGVQIASIFDRKGLAVYDKAMYSRHVERKIEQPEYSGDPSALVSNDDVRKRNLAEAYNDYADRPEVRKKYGLPSSVNTPAPITKAEVSEGQSEALSFRKGESKTYDNPRLFWSVLQEVIALENDYKSWDAYRADHGATAEKEFQRRSDIMALGGEMKVTRKR
ncbi:hypothetical protein [Lewinella sp. LCG006]|uniref:hypothetical protein n=1 Tax=Lewinella sp. LCG006 TaxID=3231911 RepID=UPI00346091AD